jgi:hypothetical protein
LLALVHESWPSLQRPVFSLSVLVENEESILLDVEGAALKGFASFSAEHVVAENGQLAVVCIEF